MNKKITMMCLGCAWAVFSTAQTEIKVSGMVQTQYQYGQRDASLKVGAANDNPQESFNRFGIRRGLLKFSAENGLTSGVVQVNITEKGIGLKDAYLNLKDPWWNTLQLRAGIFNRPFGHEIGYSATRFESPERSMFQQTLFPDERDMGVMCVLQAPKYSTWNALKLEAGLFAGNGIKPETDSRKDFIGHLSATKNLTENILLAGGVSYYNGSVFQAAGQFAKREYTGADIQFSLITEAAGVSQIRAEYIFGQQPGTATSSKSPNAATLPVGFDVLRRFCGAYVMLVQDLGRLPFSVVAKYDFYDPNTKLTSDNAASADLAQTMFGAGAFWKVNASTRLLAFYEFNRNQTNSLFSDLKDNVLTVRLQYVF